MAVSWARGAVFASLGVLVACSDEPNFGGGVSGGGQGTGADSSGGSASGGSASGGSASGGSASGGSASGGSATGGGNTGGGGGGVTPFCGDGFIDDPLEQCDDGNPADDDGCSGCIVDCPMDGYKDPVTFHCYFRLSVGNDWANRRQECLLSAPGTDAAALSTLAEYDAVTEYLVVEGLNSQTWIGGQRASDNAPWSWSNGEPWIYADGGEPWSPGSPDGTGDCTRINPSDADRDMKNEDCSNNRPMICERTPLGS